MAVVTPPFGSTVLGVIVAVTPLGTPEMVRFTGSENPFAAVTVMLRLADCVDFIVRLDVESPSEKSVTRTVNFVVCVVFPPKAEMERSNVPADARVVAVMVSCADAVVPGLTVKKFGVIETDTPAGAPVA